MFLNEDRYKDNMGVKWTIYSIIFSIICFNLVAILILFFGNAKVIEESNIESLIINGDIILAIFSLICCYTFYYIYKEDDIFIISQVYTMMTIEFIIINVLGNYWEVAIRDRFITITAIYLYEGFLLSFIVYKKNILFKYILKNKLLSCILVSFMSLLIIFGGIDKIISYGDIVSERIFSYLVWGLILFHFILVFILFKNSINTKRIIYSIFGASINILTVKNLYIFILYNKYPYNISVLGYVLTFMAFLVIIIGLFYEMIFRVKESDQLKHNLNVFYAANEKNLQSNILVYNDNYKIVYANELARGVIDEGITLEDQYNRLEKISIFNINEDLSKNIKKVLEENGTYLNILYFSELKKYYEVHLQKVVTDDSKWIIGNFIDKTDKCEAIDKLKISENRLKSVTENILDFIITIDTSGIITFANTSAIESLGFEVEELVGHRYEEFLKRDDGDIFAINNIKNSDIIKHKILCKNGKSVRVESVFKRINSEFKGYVVVSRSLEMKEELNSLRVKYNEIKEYDRIRAEFFANLSHEVRTPINIIYSCLQLLNNQKKNGHESLANYYIKYEKTISQNAFRLLRLVNNLIDISKLDTGAMQIKIKNIDIISLIENITLSTVPYVEEKNINIMFDTSIEELIVGCDPEKIERVMLNLISNSVKFTPTGGEIFVDIQVDETWVYVRVKDTGIGIPMHLKDVIFERFVQSNKSFSREREGSGIGLALVKDIISKHNGEVMLEDSSEIGSTFLFKIPNLVRDDVWHDDDNRAAETAIQEKINIEFSDIYDI